MCRAGRGDSATVDWTAPHIHKEALLLRLPPRISRFQFDGAGTGLCCWAAEPGTRAAASIPQNAHGKG